MKLSFDELRSVNVTRCITDFKHPLEMWSMAEWTNAMAGETGEACNITKKLIRIRDGHGHMNNMTEEELKAALAMELADIVIYADLVAAAAGINLGKAVIHKFNADSTKHKASTRL